MPDPLPCPQLLLEFPLPRTPVDDDGKRWNHSTFCSTFEVFLNLSP